jgi:hypothetical protein
MTAGREWERRARSFPAPRGSEPALSVLYRQDGHQYQATVGQRRRRCPRWPRTRRDAHATGPFARWRETGNTVIGIVVRHGLVEVWSREPALGWPNPSLLARDDVMNIQFAEQAGPAAS